MLKSVAKLAWLTGKGNAKKPSGIKDYQLYLEIGNPYNIISSINGGRRPKRPIEEVQEEIIIVGHKIREAKHGAKYCQRVHKIAIEDPEFMKDKKPIVLFGQGRKNNIRADCKRFIKKRTHNRSHPKASPPSAAIGLQQFPAWLLSHHSRQDRSGLMGMHICQYKHGTEAVGGFYEYKLEL